MGNEVIENAIRRITAMENILDEALLIMDKADECPEEFLGFQERIRELDEYYSGEDWKRDFQLDEEGMLPKDLKRGVLSEDGIYNALWKNKELLERIRGKKWLNT